MASAEKLDSGSWRCRSTVTINGKKVTKSFTVSPKNFPGTAKEASRKAKAQAELLAREWQIEHEKTKVLGKTVGEAMQSYIDKRLNILSPSTLRGYRVEQRALQFISHVYIQDVDTELIQSIINDLALTLSPKSIRLRIRFLLASLDFAGIDKKFKIRYPDLIMRDPTTPDHEEVSLLISNSTGIFRTIICVGAFGGLRAGEISALKEKDIIRDLSMIYIHSDMVRKLDGGGYEYKERPKTPTSTRTVHLPKEIIDLIPVADDPESYVLPVRPDKISRRFRRLQKKLNINCRFHDLRHYAASMRSDLGLSEKYVKEQLGWSLKSKVYQRVYDNALKSEKVKFNKITDAFIANQFNDAIKEKA